MVRFKVALNIPRRHGSAIVFARSVANALRESTAFPSPTFPLATFEADIAALEAAEARVLARALGAARERDVRLSVVVHDLHYLAAYVQTVADASPEVAEAVITSAGMAVKKVGRRSQGELEALHAEAH